MLWQWSEGLQNSVVIQLAACQTDIYGTADATAADGSRGSNVYEVIPWLLQFGRGRPRLGGLSVSETEERRDVVNRAGSKRGHETRLRC